ncbi:hypothetical protein F4810DRAFT_397324 [Camillea tinctor]|nr:hypothetical protein F4810DRAFT_397324 [Camillea tinctor]
MLWRSTLQPSKKLGLVILFSGGIFVIACAILRSVLMLTDPINGAQTAGSWSVRETFIATMATNLPVVFPLFRNWVAPAYRIISNSFGSARTPPKSPSRNISRRGSGPIASQRYPGTPRMDVITNVTFSESEERMVDNVHMQPLASTAKVPPNTEVLI